LGSLITKDLAIVYEGFPNLPIHAKIGREWGP
jgi:hypothetical protein